MNDFFDPGEPRWWVLLNVAGVVFLVLAIALCV